MTKRGTKRHYAAVAGVASHATRAIKKGWKTFSKGYKKNGKKAKNAKSTTKTTTKTRTKTKTIQSPTNGFSKSYTMYGNRARSKVLSKLPISIYDFMGVQGSNSSTNTQQIGVMGAADYTIFRAAFIECFNTNPAGATNQPPPGANSAGYKFYVRNAKIDLWITNQSESVCELILIDCVSKQTQATEIRPDTSMNNGIGDTRGPYTTNAATWPYARPWNYKSWRAKFKIIKTTTVELGLGRSHHHIFDHEINKVVDSTVIQTNQQVAGLSTYTMAIWKGPPADTNDTLTNVGTVGLVPIKLIWVDRVLTKMSVTSEVPANEQQTTNVLGTGLTNLYGVAPYGETCDFLTAIAGATVNEAPRAAGAM